MGLFGKSSNWVELKNKEFVKLVKGLKEYKTLARLIGQFADGSVLALWNKFSMGSGKASYAKGTEKDYKAGLSALLQHEITCVLAGHYYLGKLQVMARMKSFRGVHSRSILTPEEYGAKSSDPDDVKATRWIISTSNSLVKTADNPGAPVTATQIRRALVEASTTRDIREEATLRWLHTQLVNQAGLRPTRCMAKEAPYPSTGGAAFLLSKTFELARGLTLPAKRDPAWFDVACFLLGAVIRSHGFTDGNGRVGRGAFAAAMLAGGIPFTPLKPDAEKLIHGLDQVC